MKINPIHRELVIPGSFAECFTYELQIAWLKKEIDNVATGGGGESVKVLEEKVAALEKSVAALKNKTNTLTTSVSDIEGEINSIKTDLDNIKRNLENFATKDDIVGFISESGVDEKLSAYETIEHAEATFVKKGTTGDYVTGEQLDNKLVDYATKIELQEYVTDVQLEDYLTKTEADVTYAKKGEIPTDVLTKTEAATTYATKSEIPDVSNLATKEEIPDVSNLATKEELTTGLNDKVSINTFDSVVATLATKENVEATYAKKSELPDLADYTTKSYVDTNFLAKNDFDERIQNYAEKSELNKYVTTETAEATYAKKGEIPSDVLTKTEATSTYATKEEIPNVANLATKEELTSGLNDKVSINTFDSVVATLATKENVEATYAKKTDIPDVSDLITDVELSQTLEEYATKTEIPEGVIVDATVSADGQNPVKSQGIYNFVVDQTADLVTTEMLANKQDKLTFDETPTAGSSNPVKSSGIKTAIETATSDMLTKTEATSTYATKSEIPSLDNYVTKSEIANKQDTLTFDDVPTADSQNPVKSSGIKTAIEAATTDMLTKTEATSTYATKSEIPSLDNYVTKSEIANKQDILTFDNVPTADSQNPVKSSGIKTAIEVATTDMLTKTEADSIYLNKSESTQFVQRKRHILNNNVISDYTYIDVGSELRLNDDSLSLLQVALEYDRDVYNENGMWILDCDLIMLFSTNRGFSLTSSPSISIYRTTRYQGKQMLQKTHECSIEIFGVSASGVEHCLYFPQSNGLLYYSLTDSSYFLDIGNCLNINNFTLVSDNTHYIKVKASYKLVSSTQFTVDTAII